MAQKAYPAKDRVVATEVRVDTWGGSPEAVSKRRASPEGAAQRGPGRKLWVMPRERKALKGRHRLFKGTKTFAALSALGFAVSRLDFTHANVPSPGFQTAFPEPPALNAERVCRRAPHVLHGIPGLLAVLFLLALAMTLPPTCRAESLALKNNRGNRLFDQGKYEDAEKAYLAAQADDPGRPEVLYNLGNSLIKQKKYQEGVQSLGQAVSKGDKGTKEKGWYNTGNALFSAGKYRESADAFIQALKLNPADRDAKHNLELALIKLRQQEQQTSEKSQQQQNSKNDAREKPQSRQQNAGAMQPPPGSKPQPGESARRDESITKDQAMQLLDAMQNQEKEEQRKLLERRARSKANGKDW